MTIHIHDFCSDRESGVNIPFSQDKWGVTFGLRKLANQIAEEDIFPHEVTVSATVKQDDFVMTTITIVVAEKKEKAL